GQVVIETMMGAVKDVIAPIMGKRATEAAFPLIICFFFYILLNNWSGLLPFAETLFDIQSVNIDASQVAQYQNEGYEIVKNADIITAIKQVPIYKPANSDLNSTLALSLISFIAWIYFVMRYAGPKALYYDWFGNKADKNELPKMLYLAMFGIFFFVGCIEVVSALLRVVSLSFRLFGNNFGGEKLIASMGNFAFPFYFLEIIIGLVQALIFSLLTAIYIGLITNHDTAEH
ncbi:MAG: F0F1 ATP synthase subunit A, partial [Opitutales bacterium]